MDENKKLEDTIFEPKEKSDTTAQIGILYRSRPDWLAKWDDFRTVHVTVTPPLATADNQSLRNFFHFESSLANA